MRGVGGEACSVRAHRFGFFYSRFAPGLAPDPGSNAISLHRTRVGGTPHDLNENVALHRTPSHLIAIGVARPLKARALASLDRNRATTLLPEQPKPAQPIMTMISPNPQFVVGFAQIRAALNS